MVMLCHHFCLLDTKDLFKWIFLGHFAKIRITKSSVVGQMKMASRGLRIWMFGSQLEEPFGEGLGGEAFLEEVCQWDRLRDFKSPQ